MLNLCESVSKRSAVYTGVAGLGASVAITGVTDATHFTVVGTLTGGYAGGGWIMSHGAASYEWCDTGCKGDFVYMDWSFNMRDLGERERLVACGQTLAEIRTVQVGRGLQQDVAGMTIEQYCSAWIPCGPVVLCIAPYTDAAPHAGDVFTYGVTKPFASLDFDSIYDSRWSARWIQHLPDPLYQAPKPECEADHTAASPWREGAEFPFQPWEEARATVPSGAPALPADAAWDGHIATYAEVTGVSEPTGLVINAPAGLGYAGGTEGTPKEHSCAWNLYLQQESVVCANGTFSEVYEANGVGCLT